MSASLKTPHPLEAILKILMPFGLPGELIWENGTYIENEKARLVYYRDAIQSLRARLKMGEFYWKSLPVDCRTFIESDRLLKKRGVIWEPIMPDVVEMNSGRFSEAVLTGAIGVGKTTIALYSQAYQLYVLSCMLNPHKIFDLDPASEITTVFQSINKTLAKDVDYQRFRNTLDMSPYFTEVFPYRRDLESQIVFPGNLIVKPIAGNDAGAIGQNVIGGILDEVNFQAMIEESKKNQGKEAYDQAMNNYNTIAQRRNSRFQNQGYLPGLLCLVSSRNFPGQFTDVKEKEAQTNPRIFVYDRTLWHVKPEKFSFFYKRPSPALVELYGENCPLMFNVFIGDETRKPRIMSDEDVARVAKEDRHLVRSVPMENRKDFDRDINKALRDILGVATQAMHPFMMNQDAVAGCFGKVESIASRTDCDFAATKIVLYDKRFSNKTRPRFMHVDLALTKDYAGVAIGYVEGFRTIERGDDREILPVIRFDMTLEIRPPSGGEIVFENIRKLIYKAVELGLPIKWITFDQYQSRDSMQILAQRGFTVGYCSMDKETVPYDFTKQAFYDDRVKLPKHDRALTELIRLEMNVKKQKIDHPPNGSKDVADAIAGVIYGLTMRREVWSDHGIPIKDIPPSLLAAAKVAKAEKTADTHYPEVIRAQRYQD